MPKLRVGIIVNANLIPENGGTYSYFNSLLSGINQFTFDDSIEIINVVFEKSQVSNSIFKKPTILIKSPSFIKKTNLVQSNIGYRVLFGSLRYFFKKLKIDPIKKQLITNHIDIVYYLTPESLYFDYPFIINHWDVGHKSTFSFPELALNGNYESRHNYYSNELGKALLILTESESGSTELINYYPTFQQKIRVLPLFSNSELNIPIDPDKETNTLKSYNIQKNSYFIYPAQFWAHKNHYNLIIAFNEFITEKAFSNYKLILSGSDNGNMEYIKKLVVDLSLENSVLITGFVDNETLAIFYNNATALVMPTFLGPTNMPLIEAAQFKCPVACSDLLGHREIMGDNASYFEPSSSPSITAALNFMAKNDSQRTLMSEAAFLEIQKSNFQLHKSLVKLNTIFKDVIPIRKTWGNC